MDILSHGLWAVVGAKLINRKQPHKTVSIRWAFFWGMFPDLFAFTIPFLEVFWQRLHGVVLPAFRPEDAVSGSATLTPMMTLAYQLYNYSHSLIIFAVVFCIVWAVRRRAPLPLFGWMLHILCDIPTHTSRFFPTPALWPLLDWKFSGISWGQPWFLALDYSLLILAFLFLRRTEKQSV